MKNYDDVDSFIIASIEPAKKEGFCWIDGKPFLPGETIAIVRYGGGKDWDRAHMQCAQNSSKKGAHEGSSIERYVVAVHTGERGAYKYHVIVNDQKVYTTTVERTRDAIFDICEASKRIARAFYEDAVHGMISNE